MMRTILSRLLALVRRRHLDAQLDDEVGTHLDLLAAEYERRGMTPDQARLAARRAFGGVEPMKERYRDAAGFRLFGELAQDARFGLRLLIKDKWVTLTAACALALGIGATSTVFTIVNSLLYRDLPFADPDRVVAIGSAVGGAPSRTAGVSYADLQDWHTTARTFDGLGAALETTMNVADETAAPERVTGAYISANAFALIGEVPVLGRSFAASDERAGAAPVVILSDTLWRTRYGADPAMVGRTIRVNGVPSVVVGVMRERFAFPVRSRAWQPLTLLPSSTLTDRRVRSLAGFGRLAPGASIDQALADLRAVSATLAQRYPDTNARVELRVVPYRERVLGGRARETMPIVIAVAMFVLLIACANVANLLLARGSARAREVSVRLAIGAGRSRITRQLLVESVLLAAVAGLGGLALSLAGARAFWNALGAGDVPLPYWLGFSVDWTVFAFLATVCLGTALLCGVVPALHASRTPLAGVLSASNAAAGGTTRGTRWTNRFVVAQLALTPILLTSAGLLLRSIAAQQHIDPGVSTAGLVRMRIDLTGLRYPEVPDRVRFYQQLQERLAGLPAPATIVSHAPFEGGDSRWLASGAAAALRPQDRPIVRLVTIGTGYFDTLGTTLRRGRPFTSTDGAGGAVPAIVNERFVALHMPGLDPIGQQVTLTVPPGAGLPPRTVDVVGVAPDIRQRSTESAGGADAVVYVPYTGNPDPDANILVRSNASPGAVASLVREQLRQIDPDLPVFDIASFDDSLAASDERLGLLVFGSMIGVFAAVALTLATIGVYAVTAYAAARRTRELGLRMALGALPSQIRWLVTQTAVRQLTTGLTIGMAGSLAVGQLLQGVLIGTSSVDPVTFAAVIVLLVVVTFAASLAPARRATRLDPVAALRSE